jgi:large subunit ribosomal protein L13
MKTTLAKKENRGDKKWVLIDAKDQILGRLAVKIANVLRGRNHPLYTPNQDTGLCVVVINANKIRVTGKKESQKEYMTYSGYMGGEKYRKFADLRRQKPDYIIHRAVWGMMPKNKLSHQMMTKLRIFANEVHSHEAQSPSPLEL